MSTATTAHAVLTVCFLASALLVTCRPVEDQENGLAATPTLPATESPSATRPETVTPAHTPTPQPTPTAVPPPTPTTGPLPGIGEAVPGALPPISNDLHFLDGDSLKVWRSESGRVEEVARPAQAYQVAADGHTILVVRPAESSGAATELVLLDAGGEDLEHVLATVEDELVDIALSPDGRQVAYVTGDADPEGSALRPPEPIFVLGSSPGARPALLATCDTTMDVGERAFNYVYPCGPLVWTVDGRAILWGDGAGLWRAAPGESPALLVPNDLYEDDPPRLYRPTTHWSPDGRYQLLQAFRGAGSNRHVFDSETGQLIAVPHSTSGLDQFAYWIWAHDSGLFTVRAAQPSAGEDHAVAELWEIVGNSLALQASAPLPGGESALPTAPTRFADGRFGFVLNDGERASETRGFYILASFDEEARRAAPLPHFEGVSPPYGQSVAWAPDGSGAVVSQTDPGTGLRLAVLYISMASGAVHEMRPALGNDPHTFSWLPPAAAVDGE